MFLRQPCLAVRAAKSPQAAIRQVCGAADVDGGAKGPGRGGAVSVDLSGLHSTLVQLQFQ